MSQKNKFNDELGKKIANKRKEIGLTQSYLAKKIGKPQSVLSEYESGLKRVYPEMLYKISMALGISVMELYPIDEKIETDTKLLSRVQLIKSLPEAEKELLLRIIDLIIYANKKND